jgi:hypothetical protein
MHPSRQLTAVLAVVAVASLVLGLATDVGLFGWSLSVPIALYLGVAGIARLTRPRSGSAGRPA